MVSLARSIPILAVWTVLMSTSCAASVAPAPSVLHIQGRLTRSSGAALPDGSGYRVRASLWNAATGGAMVWSQTLDNVALNNGVFSAVLTIDEPGVFDGPPLWLETQVGDDPVMTPRQALASVPYALKANSVPDASITASKFAANALDGTWRLGGNAEANPAISFLGTTDSAGLAFRTNNVERLRLDAAGHLGIGNATPDTPLTFARVVGDKINLYPSGAGSADSRYGIGVQGRMLQLHTDAIVSDVAFGYGSSATFTETARITGTGNLKLRGKGVVEFGSNVTGKQADAGKIGYQVFTADALDIVGAGATATSRKVKVYAEGGAVFTGEITAPVVTILGGSDVAEPYDVASSGGVEAAPGMVVCIDSARLGRMRVADAAYSPMVAGIISGANGIAPGITLRQKGTVADGALPVASMGRVWALCDADANGPIAPGDLLTSSETPGHGMKASDPVLREGAVIGKAMSALASGKGLVLVLVCLN